MSALNKPPLPDCGRLLWTALYCENDRVLKQIKSESYEASGVARVPCTLGQEIFLRPPSTKLTEFELKNR